MANTDSRVTIHMVASPDGFIARKDGASTGSRPRTNSQAGTPWTQDSSNDQWRICFRFADGDAYEVEITDYH
jgi:hypothetical protein